MKTMTGTILKKITSALLVLSLLVGAANAVAPSSYAVGSEQTTMDGILICANCKQAPVAKHTVQCCLMEACAASGYGVLVAQADKTYRFYAFDDAGDGAALALLKEIQAQGVKNYISVKVSGTVEETAGSYDWSFGEKGGTIHYQGTISDVTVTYDATHADFAAKAVDLTEEMVVEVSDATYTGSAVVPDVVVKDGDYTLKPGFDYNIQCENNVEIGTAKLTISGVGAFYKGTVERTFAIKAAMDAESWAVSNKVIDSSFVPDSACTRGQAVMLLWRAVGQPEPKATGTPFSDVSEDADYYKAVLWAAETGITMGTGDGTTFSPDAIVSRAQAVTFLYRAANIPAVDKTPAFNDVASDAYYSNAVAWAAAEGITVGYSDNTFKPNGDCTCSHMVTFLYRQYAN